MISGLILSLLVSTSFAGASDAIELYNQKQYGKASVAFEQLVKEYPKSGKMHYYYANCLMEKNQKDKAIEQYKKVVDMSPNSKIGTYAKQALKKYGGIDYPPSRSAKVSGTKASSQKTKSKVQNSPAPNLEASAESDIRKRLKNLPKLVENYKSGPTKKQWQTRNSSAIGYNCYNDWQKANQAANKAQANLKKLKTLSRKMVPFNRNHGELNDHFLARRKAYESAIKTILKPYEHNREETQDWLIQKKTIMDEYSSLSGRGPIGP